MQPVYLDSNATTRPADEVVEAMVGAMREGWGNPSSVHRLGQVARQKVELSRHAVARLIGCAERELVFTSGGTEAANLALEGTLQDRGRALVTCRSEHTAVRDMAEMLERRGTEVIWIEFAGGGVVDCGQLEEILAGRAEAVGLVSIMWVNNETGVMQPLERIGEICRRHGVPLHTDATQAVGRMPVDVSDLPVDLLSFAAHKFHGPKGIGGLFVRRGVRVAPRIIGGPQERSRRGGTENVPGIVGMGAAADLAAAWLATDGRHDQAALRDRFETGILAAVPEAVINGAGSPRLWTTSNIGVPRLEAEAMLLLLSERGLSASAGAACSSGSLDPSPVLLAMGVPPEIAHGSIRFSLSRETTTSEITAALEIIPAVVEKLRRSFAATD